MIAENVLFSNAEVRGVMQFDDASIGGDLNLSNVDGYGNFSLANANVKGAAQFANSEWFGGLWLDNTQFSGLEAEDMQVHGRLWLKRARLGNQPVLASRFDISFGYTYM